MDVSIIGASGDCGREIVAQLVGLGALSPTERLQLVGRENGRSSQILFGLCSDLSDAYAEKAPIFDVALSPEDIVADVIVMSAGATVGREITSRPQLAKNNDDDFMAVAMGCDCLRVGLKNRQIVLCELWTRGNLSAHGCP
ncbi:MAG: hypothetical protein AAGL17_10450, partial [Cyanobacteria bacterium J06576_12]